MVTSIVALLLVTGAVYMNSSLARGRDGRRKADLRKSATLLEEHYNDTGYYPLSDQMTTCGSSAANPLIKYQSTLPCEPQSSIPYYYIGASCDSAGCLRYRLMTTLLYLEDPDIARAGCNRETGCGGKKADGTTDLEAKYNYGVSAGMTVAQ